MSLQQGRYTAARPAKLALALALAIATKTTDGRVSMCSAQLRGEA